MTGEHADPEAFDGWMILELMGHRRMAGLVADVEVAGSRFLRIDVYGDNLDDQVPLVTQYYSPAAVYCITPTTERLARSLSERYRPAPVGRYEIEVRRCRVCGCTDLSACDGGCYWIHDDLCSKCEGAMP